MKAVRIIFIIAAVILLLVPAALMLAGFGQASALPKLIENNSFNDGYFSELDAFAEDGFGLKKELLTLINKADALILSDSLSDGAIVGRNGFLFYAETADDYLGVGQLSEREITAIADYLSELSEELSGQGIRLAFMTAPNKATVYPEYMPAHLVPADGPRNIDLLRDALLARGVEYVDAKAILTDAKSGGLVYYERDSHWNNLGAALVYNGIAEAFGLDTVDPRSYTVKHDMVGDLNRFVYPADSGEEERLEYYGIPEWSSKRPVDFRKDKKVYTESEANGLSMVFFHDSFGRSLQPFLSGSVGRLAMSSLFPYDRAFLSDNSADVVLIELVERNLGLLAEYAISLGY